jgi:Tol biopolymer transport system component
VVTSGTLLSAISVAANGLVAYRTGVGNQRQLTWVDRSGRTLGTLGAPDGADLQYPSVSPDGRRVAVTRRVQGNTDLWLMDDTRQVRFTFDAGVDQLPVWWPDGSRIVFNSNRTGQFDLYQRLASGTAAEDRLVASDQFKTPTSVAAGGRFLLYYSIDPQTSEDLWIVPVSGNRTPFVFLKTPFRELAGVFSPDGRWVAYMADESGRMEIYVRPFTASPASGVGADGATGQWQISTTGGIYPQWRSDGKELFYVSPGGDMMAATITAGGTTLEASAPVTLFPRRIFGGRGDPLPVRAYDVARDGRFVINAVVTEVTPPITLLMNWRPEGTK